MDKRVLVVSNECLSNSSSNGRTMAKLLATYDSKLIYNFYLHGTPMPEMITRSYCVSDKMALNAFLHKNKNKTDITRTSQPNSISSEKIDKPKIRNCKNLLLRDIVWISFNWWDKDFDSFLNNAKPEVVILQAGDCPFMYAIARKIVKKTNAKLVIYNSESYVLRSKLFHGVKKYSPWHLLLRHRLRKQFKKLMKLNPYCVYIMEALENAYQNYIPHKGRSTAIYTPSDLNFSEYHIKNSGFHMSYSGSLDGGRGEILYEMANVLMAIKPDSKFTICGRATNTPICDNLVNHPIVDFRGFVDYGEVVKIMFDSDAVVQIENLSHLQARFYAFSTKIADCLTTGVPFLIYASRQFPFVQYLDINNVAFIAETKEELKEQFIKLISDVDYRASKIEGARKLAQHNHNVGVNADKFKKILQNV